MKKNRRLILLALLAVLCGQEAQAFYNASTGPWLNRDPVEEAGGANLSGFVRNNPVGQIDKFGLALYAIDGTTVNESEQANPWWLIQETKERPNRYYRGPKLDFGQDSVGKALRVYEEICEDFCRAKECAADFEVNLAGWSRGAVVAVRVAKLLNDLGCGCRPGDGGYPGGIRRYQPVPVNWVGLFDAVAQMTKDGLWPKEVPKNVTRLDHAIRTGTGENWKFPIWHFSGENEMAFDNFDGTKTTHGDIGRSRQRGNNDSYNWMVCQAFSAGVDF